MVLKKYSDPMLLVQDQNNAHMLVGVLELFERLLVLQFEVIAFNSHKKIKISNQKIVKISNFFGFRGQLTV